MSIPIKPTRTPTTKLLSRRSFTARLSGVGLTSTLLPGVIAGESQNSEAAGITQEMLAEAERLAGLEFTSKERELMVEGVNKYLEKYRKLRQIPLDNSVAPAIQFNPVLPEMQFEKKQLPIKISEAGELQVPSNLEDLAFWPVTDLARLIESRRISSVELTNMYLVIWGRCMEFRGAPKTCWRSRDTKLPGGRCLIKIE
jgi:hypothetical protein